MTLDSIEKGEMVEKEDESGEKKEKRKGERKKKKWIIGKMSVRLWGWRQDLKLWGDFVVA